jgi:hypothetical protein
VTLKSADLVLKPDQPIHATLEGQFLYGAPAAGLRGEAELRIVRDPSPVPDAKGYSFGLADEKVNDTVQKLDVSDADDTGQVRISTVFRPPTSTTAPLKGILSAGLFEPDGRIVEDRVELPIRTDMRRGILWLDVAVMVVIVASILWVVRDHPSPPPNPVAQSGAKRIAAGTQLDVAGERRRVAAKQDDRPFGSRRLLIETPEFAERFRDVDLVRRHGCGARP